jgi:CheY-like chemotaxis protein
MTISEKQFFQEFKAPLISIIGMTELLEQSEQTVEQKSITRSITQTTTSLLNLVNQVLDRKQLVEPDLIENESMKSLVNELRELVNNQQSLAKNNTPDVDVSQIKVLVVEDNPLIQLVIMKQLASLGINADAVSDGQAAVDAAPSFDLIFMDCRLPVLDGFAATQAIRQAEKEGEKPRRIVALTAGYEEKTRDKCIESGMDDCLIKPVGRAALKAMIERWFKLTSITG